MLNNTTNTNKKINKHQITLSDTGKCQITLFDGKEHQDISEGGARCSGGVPSLYPGVGVPLSSAHIRPFAEWYEGASILKISKGRKTERKGGGQRKAIKGFSYQSRRRLMRTIGAIRRDAVLPDFVTLTYPDNFPDVKKAKRDLKIFLQRFERAYPNAGAVWKLEPQKRGAPHFHLLVWGCNTQELFKWVAFNWYEIAGEGDQKHLFFHLGAFKGSVPCVQRVRSFNGVMAYASKYLGKTFEVSGWGDAWTGRYWGVYKRENIPFGQLRSERITYKKACVLMRYQRRHSGVKYRSGRDNTLTVFCDADQWVNRLILEGDTSPP